MVRLAVRAHLSIHDTRYIQPSFVTLARLQHGKPKDNPTMPSRVFEGVQNSLHRQGRLAVDPTASLKLPRRHEIPLLPFCSDPAVTIVVTTPLAGVRVNGVGVEASACLTLPLRRNRFLRSVDSARPGLVGAVAVRIGNAGRLPSDRLPGRVSLP